MTAKIKHYSEAAKRRAKKLAALPGLPDVPRRAAQGKKRMKQIAAAPQEPDAPKVVLQARARHMGHTGDLDAMRNPALSEPAGMAIYALHGGDTAKALWDTYTAFTAAEMNYHRRCLSASVHAKTAKIEMMPERLETRADDVPDFRSDDEKARDAERSWMRWRGYIGHLGAIEAAPIFDVWRGRVQAMEAGQITLAGRAFVEAMVKLQKVVAKAG